MHAQHFYVAITMTAYSITFQSKNFHSINTLKYCMGASHKYKHHIPLLHLISKGREGTQMPYSTVISAQKCIKEKWR